MATIKISDLHIAELEHQLTALTDDEQASIQGGGIKLPSFDTIKNVVTTAAKWGNRAVNAAYVGSGAKELHDAGGHWWSFL